MTRIVKEYAVRRDEILDAAERLIYTKGYEQMTIQDILDALQIAKGTFYHYFDSKQSLVEAIIERMMGAVKQILVPLAEDSDMPALEKLQRLFDASNRWKTAQKPIVLALLKVWYTDDNALVRQKVAAATLTTITPLLTTIIQQGVQEGVLTTAYPDTIGEVIVALLQNAGDAIGGLFLAFDPERDDLSRAERTLATYTDALERLLGAPSGSLSLVDEKTLQEWFSSANDNPL